MPDDPAATSWSAQGAVIAAAGTKATTRDKPPSETPFAVAMNALSTVIGVGPQSWNDRPERCQNDVLAAFTAAHLRLLEESAHS